MSDSDTHSGHRRRMYDKLIAGDKLYEHELLEMLLYNAFPRINTNAIAHRLLEKFGTIYSVFNADYKEIKTVEGMGESTALYLCCVGRCALHANNVEGIVALRNYADFKDFTASRFRGRDFEYLELYFIGRDGILQRIHSFTSYSKSRAEIPAEQLVRLFNVNRPYGLCIAHNHLTGDTTPSESDDLFTRRCQLICALNGVRLLDHCIYSDGAELYSFRSSGRLTKIENEISTSNLDRWIKQTNRT